MQIRFVAAFVVLLVPTNLGAADYYFGAGIGPKVEAGVFRHGQGDLERFAEADGETWKLFAGLELGPHLALEVATMEFGSQRCCGNKVADLGFTSDVGGYSLATIGRWPVGRIVPFAKIGYLDWSEDGEFVTLVGTSPRSAEGDDLLLGAGLDLEFPDGYVLRAEWERYEFDGASADSVTASLVVRFRH